MEKSEQRLREKIIRGLMKLAFGKSNDAALLLFGNPEELVEQIKKMDLYSMCSIKRSGNTVEIRFFDRMQALDRLLELVRAEEKAGGMDELIRAFERSEEE